MSRILKRFANDSCFFLLLCLGLPSCSWWEGSRYAESPVVQVNSQTLTAKDFAAQLANRLKAFDALTAKDPNNVSRIKEEIIKNFIMRSLLLEYAKSQKVEVSDQEVEKEINSIRSSYPDDLSFRRSLADSGQSFSEWNQQIRATVLTKKVFSKIVEKVQKPSEKEVQVYFEANKERFKRKERVYLRQIVVDELTKAEAIHDELKKQAFPDLARKYSVAPESKNGGLVGWIEKGSVDIFDKAFTLPIGAISSVLESPYGFHIFKVERKASPGYAALDEVKAIIEQELMGQREQAEFSAWLDQQIRSSRVLRNESLVRAMTVETRAQ